MEVAIGTNGTTPFQREVREWQRIDPNTGALLTGRLEADRWINGPLNSYGKVVDSQNISQPNGTQQSQRKQLELYQARTSSGSMQVIRAQTVQTTSSRWSSPSSTVNSFENQRNTINNMKNHFNNVTSSNSSSNNNNNSEIHKNLTTNHNNDDNDHNKHIINNHHNYQNKKNHQMLTAPSLKLSNLMKSSNNNCNGGGNSLCGSEKINPHCINSSMPLIQNHQKTELQRKQDNNIEITKPIPTKSSLMLQYTKLNDNSNRYEQHLLQHNQQQQKQLPPTTVDFNNRVGGVVDFDYDGKEHKNSMINKFTKEKETDFYTQRGRSVSTDDLSTEWNENNNNNNNNSDDVKDESSEWRRVSKIRRSFQFPKTSSPPKTYSARPIDLPENSVSVSRIRQELENCRRLNTAMRNNNVDLAALDTILNNNLETSDLSPITARKTAFLTSESLKEIRGKLKKLSDESLYKDDFITNGTVTLDLKDDNDIKQIVITDQNQKAQKSSDFLNKTNTINQTVNNFENRSRYRDTSSAEWHLRRKSYGFEKMTPPDNKTMYRQETSTDSGIGRSSELGNWSPTESKGTIIAFGEQPKISTTVVLNGENIPKVPLIQRRLRKNSDESESNEMKRHSIAVDETKYVRDNLRKVFDTKTSIHLNGFYAKDNSTLVDEIGRQRKRVEFCKTEVHFAAESGRVNIVETDGKPPPNNNFRRRRRSSGNTYLDAITSGLQIMHFGDEKKATILEQESESSEDLTAIQNNVTVSIPIVNGIRNREENTNTKNMLDEIEQDEISLRGILKNKPIKPKPYHLGENIDTGEKFWGIKLKPVTTSAENNRIFENDTSNICDAEKPDISKTGVDHVKIVEERKNGAGYSTKINLNLTDAPFEWNTNSETIKSLKLSATNTIDKVDFSKNSSHLITVNKTNEQCFKSTSLIMQQIRANSNQIDDETHFIQKPIKSSSAIISKSTKLVSDMTTIAKSNSANSIFLEKQRQIYRPQYTTSLNGDVIIDEPSFYHYNTLKTSHNPIDPSSYNTQQTRFMSVVSEEPQRENEKKPIPTPRIKVIGSNSCRAAQIRRICDSSVINGGFESDDSAKADEEVKSYLGGSENNNDDFNSKNVSKASTAEILASWSRIKAQRFVQKSKVILKEVPQSNIMSIELRSPELALKKIPSLNLEDTNKYSPQVPIAKPRTTVKSSSSPENDNMSGPKAVESHHSYPQRYQTKIITNEPLPIVKEPLKIVTATNGARKLREHELCYFGVKVNTDDNNIQRITNTDIKNSKTNYKNIDANPNVVTSKWKLSNDKPDLLRHSPVDSTSSPVVINLNDQSPDRNVTENVPIYENLQTHDKYNRNTDLDRDEKILSEMSKSADQSMKAVTDRHKLQAQKYQQRIEMHSSTPLDTIDEKRSTRTFYDLESEENLKPTVLPTADSFQRKCCSRRSSSASSTGSVSDSGSVNKTQSRSRSREKYNNNNVVVKLVKKSSLPAVVVRPRTEHRSSSRDSQKSHNNSIENIKMPSPPQKVERKFKRTVTSHSTYNNNNDKPEPMPRHRREELKTKSSSSRKELSQRNGEKSSSYRKESKTQHGEKPSIDRKEVSRHHRERSSNDVIDPIDRHKQNSRVATRVVTPSDNHKHSSRSSKDPSNIRSSQRSATNRTDDSHHVKSKTESHVRHRSSEERHNLKTRTNSHDRHRSSEEHHKNSSSTRSSTGKPKVTSSTDQKHRSVRSPNGITTNPTIVNTMTKTSTTRHHRSRKDQPRK